MTNNEWHLPYPYFAPRYAHLPRLSDLERESAIGSSYLSRTKRNQRAKSIEIWLADRISWVKNLACGMDYQLFHKQEIAVTLWCASYMYLLHLNVYQIRPSKLTPLLFFMWEVPLWEWYTTIGEKKAVSHNTLHILILHVSAHIHSHHQAKCY
jgi:hypothetical protein